MSEVAEPRLFGNRTPEDVIEEAHERYGPFVSRVCLFSGGNDSLAAAHRCRDHYDELVWIDTRTSVPGVREFVEQAAEWLDKPLLVYACGDDAYRRIVLGDPKVKITERKTLGFPGPMQHTRCYTNLKEVAIAAMLRDLKTGGTTNRQGTARVLAVTGLRRGESKRRRERAEITKRGALVFANPIADWTNTDLARYRADHDLIESDVAALLHRSGECNCGSYAVPGEREMLASLWPAWFEQTIAPIEREAKAMGLPCPVWGSGRDYLDSLQGDPGELCSDCQLRFEAA